MVVNICCSVLTRHIAFHYRWLFVTHLYTGALFVNILLLAGWSLVSRRRRLGRVRVDGRIHSNNGLVHDAHGQRCSTSLARQASGQLSYTGPYALRTNRRHTVA